MVLPLGPARFYGSALPRPFIYSDVKFNSERVDPPMGVTAPFMTWAKDAHWSMGGVCLKRKRMQGKIEGNVKKLRDEEEKETKIKNRDEKKKKEEEKKNKKRKTDKDVAVNGDLVSGSPKNKGTLGSENKGTFSPNNKGISSPKSPPAPSQIDSPTDSSPTEGRVFKRKWSDKEEDEEEDLSLVVPESEKPGKKRSPRFKIRVRKLGDVFNQHATDGSDAPGGEGTESHKVPSVAMQATKRQAGKIMNVYDYVAVPDRVMKVAPKRASPRKNPGKSPTIKVPSPRKNPGKSSAFKAPSPSKNLEKSPAFKVPSPVDSVRRSSRLSLTPSEDSR